MTLMTARKARARSGGSRRPDRNRSSLRMKASVQRRGEDERILIPRSNLAARLVVAADADATLHARFPGLIARFVSRALAGRSRWARSGRRSRFSLGAATAAPTTFDRACQAGDAKAEQSDRC